MESIPLLPLPTALYEWNKQCPKDLVKDLEAFFHSKEFLDRPNVFYKGVDSSNDRWVALISVQGAESTRTMMFELFQFKFMELHESQDSTFSQVSPAPRMPAHAAYNAFIKDIVKANKAIRARAQVQGYGRELQRAAEMVNLGPGKAMSGTDENPSPSPWAGASVLTTKEHSAATSGMWFVCVDIESYERNHALILEIGWTIWDSKVNKFGDNHYAISDYRHLKNGRYVADRRDRFQFGKTVWASLTDSIAAFQRDLNTAAAQNDEGLFVLIAHDMTSDETYLKNMGVTFPEGIIKFDTLNLNVARTGDRNKSGLGKLLDSLEIENYSLHNAGNDAHYTMELFMYLTRDHTEKKIAELAGGPQ
ncbi:hypothetical protein B0O80DRAFT_484809 [Mortierella sp. GBAus27b]|nr:hypothetical protein BGX31_003456 [Mortierella sp. GBA43]KAI8358698.1 hypothetical protein B0O80DRAFT_484809 [Mortierella sp. GBAus27b]